MIAHANRRKDLGDLARLVAGSGCPSDNGPRWRWSWPAPPLSCIRASSTARCCTDAGAGPARVMRASIAAAFGIGDIVQAGAMLRGIKRRAESRAQHGTEDPHAPLALADDWGALAAR